MVVPGTAAGYATERVAAIDTPTRSPVSCRQSWFKALPCSNRVCACMGESLHRAEGSAQSAVPLCGPSHAPESCVQEYQPDFPARARTV